MRVRSVFWVALLCLAWALVACGQASGPATSATAEENLLDSAAAEATAIVQRAQATALVLQARAQATALVGAAGETAVNPPRPTLALVVAPSQSPQTVGDTVVRASASPVDGAPAVGSAQTPPPVGDLSTVEVLGVGFAADGGLIMVQFLAPPRVAGKWWPGSVSVTDEGSGMLYNEIPVMPKIGPLIGRPVKEGQLGYVMLVNAPPFLQPGALVTVVLGEYQFEHVPVK